MRLGADRQGGLPERAGVGTEILGNELSGDQRRLAPQAGKVALRQWGHVVLEGPQAVREERQSRRHRARWWASQESQPSIKLDRVSLQ